MTSKGHILLALFYFNQSADNVFYFDIFCLTMSWGAIGKGRLGLEMV
jgi:hypothetical protein